jgi:hypothetical protein
MRARLDHDQPGTDGAQAMTGSRLLWALLGAMHTTWGVAADAVPAIPAPTIVQRAVPGTPASDAPADLGRLFFTPAQRAAMDEARRRPQAAPGAQAQEPPQPPPSGSVTLNGIVRRSDGATTIWLNNKQVRGRKSDDGVLVRPSRVGAAPGSVTVQLPQTGRVVDIRVGQQLEIDSGEVKEAYRAAPSPGAAEAPTHTRQIPTDSHTPRRSSRERDLLRDLLREIESPAQSGAAPGADASAAR